MNWDLVLRLLPLILTILIYPALNYWIEKKINEKAVPKSRDGDYDKQFVEIRTHLQTVMGYQVRIIELETKMKVFWTMIERSTADLLHRDDTPNIDKLLEKLPADRMSAEERHLLKEYLIEIQNNEERPRSDRYAAILLRASITARFPNDDKVSG